MLNVDELKNHYSQIELDLILAYAQCEYSQWLAKNASVPSSVRSKKFLTIFLDSLYLIEDIRCLQDTDPTLQP